MTWFTGQTAPAMPTQQLAPVVGAAAVFALHRNPMSPLFTHTIPIAQRIPQIVWAMTALTVFAALPTPSLPIMPLLHAVHPITIIAAGGGADDVMVFAAVRFPAQLIMPMIQAAPPIRLNVTGELKAGGIVTAMDIAIALIRQRAIISATEGDTARGSTANHALMHAQ